MITAAEARKRSEDHANIAVQNQLRDISASILTSIEMGGRRVIFRDNIHNGTKKELEDLGYSVSIRNDRNDNYTVIYW